ncbi:MAG TPA: PASTA domain-containing protein [Chloroflexi bacterium]|nr:PASTA domain-containing protein [Chloroflexota bacterium]
MAAAQRAEPAALPTAEAAGPDWRTWILGAVAVIAIIGLVPLWALVYRAWVRSSALPTMPLLATPTATIAMVTVPDVQGLNWEEARITIEAEGLRFTLEEQTGAAAPEGTVVRQEPLPGQPLPRGSEVRLYIAGPPEIVEVPGVVDVPVEVARNWLEQSGLQITVGTTWSTSPISTVITQEPERGTQVEAGSVVTLTVSGGTSIPIEINANLNNLILLEQAELLQARFHPGDLFSISLRWRALAPIPTRYAVFVHLIGPTGELVAQEDVEPFHGAQPTNTWTPGVSLWDLHQVNLPLNAPPGTYQVRTGMYPQGQPGSRLPVVDPGETSAEFNSILIAEVEVGP